MATVTETMQVAGIRCERCVMRLAKTLEGHDELEAANANLMGLVSRSPTTTSARVAHALVDALTRGGFRPLEAAGIDGSPHSA